MFNFSNNIFSNMSEIVLSVSENEENLTPANSRVAYFADFARNYGIVLLPNITVSSFSNCTFPDSSSRTVSPVFVA